MSSCIQYVTGGMLRAQAVTTATRSDALPDIPTLPEFVRGYEASQWYGIGAPKGTPAAVIDKLNKEINAVAADPIIKARLAGLGFDPMSTTSAEFGKSIAAETEKWANGLGSSGGTNLHTVTVGQMLQLVLRERLQRGLVRRAGGGHDVGGKIVRGSRHNLLDMINGCVVGRAQIERRAGIRDRVTSEIGCEHKAVAAGSAEPGWVMIRTEVVAGEIGCSKGCSVSIRTRRTISAMGCERVQAIVASQPVVRRLRIAEVVVLAGLLQGRFQGRRHGLIRGLPGRMIEIVEEVAEERMIDLARIAQRLQLAGHIVSEVGLEREGIGCTRSARLRVGGGSIGNRRIVDDGTSLAVIGIFEVCELIAPVEREMRRVHAVAHREHAVGVGRLLKRAEIDVAQIDLVRAGQRTIAGESGNGAGKARRMVEDELSGRAMKDHGRGISTGN